MRVSRLVNRLWRYGVLGIVINLGCYLVFLLLLASGTRPVTANAACYVLGLVLGYVGNRTWTFRSEGRHGPDLLRFGGAHLAGFATSMATIAVLVRVMPAALAQVGAVLTAAAVIFAALQLLGFGQSKQKRSAA